MNDSSIESRVRVAVAAALDKKAYEVDVLALSGLTSIADYFILATASNERQAQAIADSVVSELFDQLRVKPMLIEGTNPGRWILLDFGDFIVHVFTEDCRRFYALERLWGDAPNVTAQYTDETAATPHELQKTS